MPDYRRAKVGGSKFFFTIVLADRSTGRTAAFIATSNKDCWKQIGVET
jgi:hypothetical protein